MKQAHTSELQNLLNVKCLFGFNILQNTINNNTKYHQKIQKHGSLCKE